MSDPLEDLHAREAELISALPAEGFFEERGPAIERAGVPGQWLEVLRGYVRLLETPAYRLEALRRAVFLVWYASNEPWQLTGLRDIDRNLQLEVLRAVESELQSPNPDAELRSMLAGYGDGLPFGEHPEFNATLALVRGSAAPGSEITVATLSSRGAMGAYWLSREDLPNMLQQPTSGAPGPGPSAGDEGAARG